MRKLLTILGAYLIAIQVLVAGFAAGAAPLTSDLPLVICASHGDGQTAPDLPQLPACHDQCCLAACAIGVAVLPTLLAGIERLPGDIDAELGSGNASWRAPARSYLPVGSRAPPTA